MNGHIAVDIGGTFTDLVYFDEARGLLLEKVPTVPANPADGVLSAIDKGQVDLHHVSRFFHGTTLGINTLLEGKGAITGLIATAGEPFSQSAATNILRRRRGLGRRGAI